MEANAKKNELLVGLFLLVGLAVLGGLIIRFGALSDSFKESYPLTVTFADASGITEGAPVKLGGATVGRVSKTPELNDNFTGVIVHLGIYTGLHIPENSEFRVGSSGLMGDALIEILPPEKLTGRAIVAGARIDGTKTAGLSGITASAQDVAKKTQVVLGDIQIAVHELTRAVDKVNDGFLTEKNMQSFSSSLDSLGKTIDRLDTKVLSDENIEDLRGTVADLRETGRNLKDGSAKFGPFIDKLDPVVADVRNAATKLETTFESLDTTAKDISVAVKTATKGDGLIAALLNDSELKTNLRLFAANLKEHGILRYKDDAMVARDGSVVTSDGRPSTQPTYTKPRTTVGPLKSRVPRRKMNPRATIAPVLIPVPQLGNPKSGLYPPVHTRLDELYDRAPLRPHRPRHLRRRLLPPRHRHLLRI